MIYRANYDHPQDTKESQKCAWLYDKQELNPILSRLFYPLKDQGVFKDHSYDLRNHSS